MKECNFIDNIVSFILGILIVLIFWITFYPRYIVIKNNGQNQK